MKQLLGGVIARRPRLESTFRYTVEEMNRIRAANDAIAQRHGRWFSDGFAAFKKSDTLFILGSGPSINELSTEDFEFIAQKDSVGFNFWLVHAFVPRFYVFQMPAGDRAGFARLLGDRAPEYRHVPTILRGTELGRDPEGVARLLREEFGKEDFFLMNEFPIHSKCAVPIDDLITFVENLGLFEFGRVGAYTVKWRGTLGLIISMGYQLGYRRMVLCGIDMNDDRHFYDEPAYAAARAAYDLPAPGAGNIRTMMSRRHGPNTVADYVSALSRRMDEVAGVELLLASPTSALRDVLPLWRR
jgi:hypothetical protein